MVNLRSCSLKISNYKCFGGRDPQGFDEIRPINLIIGKNNSGKSSLLELVENSISFNKEIISLSPNTNPPLIQYSNPLLEEDIKKVFQLSRQTSDVPGTDDFKHFGKYWVDQEITWQQEFGNRRLINIKQPPDYGTTIPDNYGEALANNVGNPLQKLKFKRLFAERDIKSEADDSNIGVSGNGRGLTNVINQFINSDGLPSDLVEVEFLNQLNSIMVPDAEFLRILVQKNSNTGSWEIYLQETSQKRVSLTHSGSGLQTIILVLAFLYLIPYLEKGNSKEADLSTYLFAFEELENNLHPSLQRRLLLYLRSFAQQNGCHIFLTTHSNVAIDLFSNDEIASIIHVTHDGQNATAKTIDTYVGRKGILDDLEFRASDLLQANGIVWVEGPSDKIYFNRWIELVSEGRLREGRHYQCVFYGGRLLSHLSAETPDDNQNDLIKILQVNRNAMMIMDSDLKGPEGDINATKKRMIDELKSNGGFSWVTEGREVENYIPHDALKAYYGKRTLVSFRKTQKISTYLEKVKAGEGRRFENNKVQFAIKIRPHITVDRIEKTGNLKKKILECVKHIEKWNDKV